VLRPNGTVWSQYPRRMVGGVLAEVRQLWGRTELRNIYVGEGLTDSKGAIPSGHLAPSAWVLAPEPGGMSAYVGTVVQLSTGLLPLAAGRNIDGTSALTLSVADAALQLIVSATGTASITFAASGTAAGVLSASGASTVTLSLSVATLGAVADLVAAAGLSLTGAGTIRAVGHLETDTTPAAVTPTTVAQAVWAALSAENDVAGTMGRLLNSAGGAADPDAIAAAVWAYLSRTLTGTPSVNVTQVAGITVDGSGTEADPWGPA
jgi:hypothetical protein